MAPAELKSLVGQIARSAWKQATRSVKVPVLLRGSNEVPGVSATRFMSFAFSSGKWNGRVASCSGALMHGRAADRQLADVLRRDRGVRGDVDDINAPISRAVQPRGCQRDDAAGDQRLPEADLVGDQEASSALLGPQPTIGVPGGTALKVLQRAQLRRDVQPFAPWSPTVHCQRCSGRRDRRPQLLQLVWIHAGVTQFG